MLTECDHPVSSSGHLIILKSSNKNSISTLVQGSAIVHIIWQHYYYVYMTIKSLYLMEKWH